MAQAELAHLTGDLGLERKAESHQIAVVVGVGARHPTDTASPVPLADHCHGQALGADVATMGVAGCGLSGGSSDLGLSSRQLTCGPVSMQIRE